MVKVKDHTNNTNKAADKMSGTSITSIRKYRLTFKVAKCNINKNSFRKG